MGIPVDPPLQVPIYSGDGNHPPKLAVPLQEQYIGAERAISSKLADVPCSKLGIPRLLKQLNHVLGTSYHLNQALQTLLQTCEGFDFGTAYGYLRNRWYADPSWIMTDMAQCEINDRNIRATALDERSKVVYRPSEVPPRRLWDLCSNRVVPFWATRLTKHEFAWSNECGAVSHSWVDLKLRVPVDTPINSHQWPVPIPKGATLDRIRIELLNLGLEYVWLDVLCLRQSGKAGSEELLKEESKLDIPTIGGVYHQQHNKIYYYSGLGLPFKIDNIEGERHWLNRAWVLQESGQGFMTEAGSLVAGITSDSPVQASLISDIQHRYLPFLPESDGGVRKFIDQVTRIPFTLGPSGGTYDVLGFMRKRASTSDLDKISGLVYLLGGWNRMVPYFDAKEPLETAWSRLLCCIDPEFLGDLLFFPVPGAGKSLWRPTWKQLMEAQELPHRGHDSGPVVLCDNDRVEYAPEFNYFWSRIRCLWSCRVEGLDKARSGSRKGKLIVRDAKGTGHSFQVVAYHAHPIPSGDYCLVGNSLRWAVGHARQSWEGGYCICWFSKVSAINLERQADERVITALEGVQQTVIKYL